MRPIPYGRHNIDDDDIKAVIETLKSDFMTQGPKVAEFEDKVAKYHKCKYAVAFSNGTTALHGAYFASGIGEGDEFISPAMTFVSSSNAGIYMGAKPILCDISMDTYNIDIEQIFCKITDKTKVITAVSYAGKPVDIKVIRQQLQELQKEIVIIHDAAHAIGSKYEGANVCDFADMAMLSFHPVKHVATGEGGIILTNNKTFYDRLTLFRTMGITKSPELMTECHGDWYYEMQSLGNNYRLTDLQCALGISQMNKVEASIRRRNEIATIYDEELKDIPLLTPKNNFCRNWVKGGDMSQEKNIHSYHLYPVLLQENADRKHFFDYMRENNVMVQVHYIPINFMPYYKENFGYKTGDFKNAENFYWREVSLPMFPALTESQQSYVIDVIKKYF